MIQGLDDGKFIANGRIDFFKIRIVVFGLVNDLDGPFGSSFFVQSPKDFSKAPFANLVLDFVKFFDVFSELTGVYEGLGIEFDGFALFGFVAAATRNAR